MTGNQLVEHQILDKFPHLRKWYSTLLLGRWDEEDAPPLHDVLLGLSKLPLKRVEWVNEDDHTEHDTTPEVLALTFSRSLTTAEAFYLGAKLRPTNYQAIHNLLEKVDNKTPPRNENEALYTAQHTLELNWL